MLADDVLFLLFPPLDYPQEPYLGLVKCREGWYCSFECLLLQGQRHKENFRHNGDEKDTFQRVNLP